MVMAGLACHERTNPPGGGEEEEEETPEVIQVAGSLRTLIYDEGFEGATVQIGSQSTTTDASGNFTIDGVTPPYDLRVSYTVGEKTSLHVVEGLTRADPVLELNTYKAGTNRLALVEGTVSGPTFPLGENEYVQVVAVTIGGGTASNIIPPGATSGDYSFVLSWRGETSQIRNLYALQYTVDSESVPNAFTAYGKTTSTLVNDQTVSGQNITLGAVTSASVTTTVTQATPLATIWGSSGVRFEPGCVMEFPQEITGNFSSVLPVLTSGASHYVTITGSFPEGAGQVFAQRQLQGATTATLTSGTPLTALPASGTTYAPGTTFSWDSKSSGIFAFALRDGGGTARAIILTRRSQVTLPEGVSLPSGTYTWSVYHQAEQADTDAAATPLGLTQTTARTASPTQTLIVP